MADYASANERQIAEGVALTDSADKLSALLVGAEQPVTVGDMEAALRPDLDGEEHTEPFDWDCEVVGKARFYPWGDQSYSLVMPKHGLLPGRWYGWDSALAAYGYFLGGETSGPLADLVESVGEDRQWGHYVTLNELQKFAKRS